MTILRSFIAGIIVPSIFIPFGLSLFTFFGHREMLNVLFIHWLPVIWGIWNVLYIKTLQNYLPANKLISLFLSGAILGIILAFIGVFIIGVNSILDIPNYIPLIGVPLLYGVIWAALVGPLNKMLGVK